MNRKAFHLLLIRYLEGTCSEEERLLVDQWYDLLEDDEAPPVSEQELSGLEERLWENVRARLEQPVTVPEQQEEKENIRTLRPWIRWAAAAAILTALFTGLYEFRSRNRGTDSLVAEKVQEGLLQSSNTASLPESLRLEDGSLVILEPGAAIAYPKHFSGSRREVFLEGQAFFDVTRNADQPFFVYNKNIVAEVLGTSFDISIVNNKVEVAVRTGRVAVFENGKQVDLHSKEKIENGVIVTPNQKATFYVEDRHFITSLVDAPVPVRMADSLNTGAALKFVYDDTPLSEVLSAIEKTYQIEILLENENLGKCPFTGDISNQPLFNKLELVCQTFQANYEVEGTRILIKGGKGCN